MPNQKKIKALSELIEKIKQAPHFVLVNFEKTSHQKLEELRKSLNRLENNASLACRQTGFKVIKNSLFKIAAKRIKKEKLAEDEVLKGHSALLTLPKDWSSSLSVFYQFAKSQGGLSFKIGIIDNQVYQKQELIKLSELPSKSALIAKLAFVLKSPQIKTIYAMKFNMIKLINIIKNKKGGETA